MTITQKALSLLETVPAEAFMTGEFTDGRNKCDAFGHFNRLISKNPNDYSYVNCEGMFGATEKESNEFLEATRKYFKMIGSNRKTIVDFNDSLTRYNPEAIKIEILRLLNAMIEKGF